MVVDFLHTLYDLRYSPSRGAELRSVDRHAIFRRHIRRHRPKRRRECDWRSLRGPPRHSASHYLHMGLPDRLHTGTYFWLSSRSIPGLEMVNESFLVNDLR